MCALRYALVCWFALLVSVPLICTPRTTLQHAGSALQRCDYFAQNFGLRRLLITINPTTSVFFGIK